MKETDLLIKVIKQQAEAFLLDAGEFFPFGTYINSKNEVVPFSAYIEDENDRPKSQPLIDMLEEGIQTRINNGKCIVGAVAYDVFIHENQEKFEAIVIRIFENDNFVERCFKYSIHENHVDFF
jgi:hypothetical protein